MSKDTGNSSARRKNIQFKSKGKNALHDTAVHIIEQHRRGNLNDFLAAAVVYYSMALSHKVIPKDFFAPYGLEDISKHSLAMFVSFGGEEPAHYSDNVAPMPHTSHTHPAAAPIVHRKPIDRGVTSVNNPSDIVAPELMETSKQPLVEETQNGQLSQTLMNKLVFGFGQE